MAFGIRDSSESAGLVFYRRLAGIRRRRTSRLTSQGNRGHRPRPLPAPDAPHFAGRSPSRTPPQGRILHDRCPGLRWPRRCGPESLRTPPCSAITQGRSHVWAARCDARAPLRRGVIEPMGGTSGGSAGCRGVCARPSTAPSAEGGDGARRHAAPPPLSAPPSQPGVSNHGVELVAPPPFAAVRAAPLSPPTALGLRMHSH